MLRRLVGLVGAGVILLSGCGGSDATGGAQDRPLVIAAFYPLQFAAEEIGGSAIEVRSLTPSGVEPHDLELSSGQVRDLADADLVVYLGEGFQPALEDALEGLDRERQFDALERKDLMSGENEEGETGPDPHVWLDPSILASIAGQLAERLSDIDPGNAEMFSRNASLLEDQLGGLDRELAEGLKSCRSRDLVTSHAAFGYLAARYDLKQVSISGIDPEAEPSPARLAEIARFVKDHDVSTIFFEELAPPDLAETLARETGARTDVLSPLETPPEQGDFLDEMRRNLERLREALDCE
jgi:zinc transport system substrate-binding protein